MYFLGGEEKGSPTLLSRICGHGDPLKIKNQKILGIFKSCATAYYSYLGF